MLKKLMSIVLILILIFGIMEISSARIGDSGYEGGISYKSPRRENHF